MKNKSIHIVAALLAVVAFSSCGGDTDAPATDDTTTREADTSSINEVAQFKYDKLISNVPIPFDILKTHANAGLTYNGASTNSTSNLSKYSTSYAKAMNLGIYGGDLAYCITYEKFEEMGSYLKCAKKLADDLGIPLAFDQQALSTFKQYETNPDSLERLVFASYSEVDKTLKSNDRLGLASLVVTGGWIEGLHTTLKTVGDNPKNYKNHQLFQKIWEQKNHLEMIINLLNEFREESTYVNLVIDLTSIKTAYDSLSTPGEINEIEVAMLSKTVEDVRNRMVNAQ